MVVEAGGGGLWGFFSLPAWNLDARRLLQDASPLSRGGRTCGVVGVLLKRGADLDVREQEGKKPLHIVAQLGRTELAELLIGYGAGPKNWR